jgi:hypothetical protein
MTIPHPDNPQHVENLTSIPLLEAQGWRGIDASLEISVFEYDFAWRELDKPDEYGDDHVFLYRVRHAPLEFDCLSMKSSQDLRQEYAWVDWISFLSTMGASHEEWDAQPFAIRIFDLLNYYGYENIFGSSHWGGFKIERP